MKGVIFDLNGTLVIGEYPSWEYVLKEELGLEKLSERSFELEELRDVARGKIPLENLLSKLFKIEDTEDIINKAFIVYASKVNLREDAKQVLNELKKSYQLILCSDTTGVAKTVVRKFDLSKYFDRMFFSCDVGFLKSEEGFWRTCLSEIHCRNPEEFFVVGDRPATDVYWPRKLGMHTVLIRSEISSPEDWVDKPKGLPDEEPEYRIENLSEVLGILSSFK